MAQKNISNLSFYQITSMLKTEYTD